MFKKDLIEDPASCLNQSADDEPVFLLCARDPIAAQIVRAWAAQAHSTHTHADDKIADARGVEYAMLQWRHDQEVAARTPEERAAAAEAVARKHAADDAMRSNIKRIYGGKEPDAPGV